MSPVSLGLKALARLCPGVLRELVKQARACFSSDENALSWNPTLGYPLTQDACLLAPGSFHEYLGAGPKDPSGLEAGEGGSAAWTWLPGRGLYSANQHCW